MASAFWLINEPLAACEIFFNPRHSAISAEEAEQNNFTRFKCLQKLKFVGLQIMKTLISFLFLFILYLSLCIFSSKFIGTF